MLKNQFKKINFLFITIFLFAISLSATTITWIGGNGNWNVAGNWDTGAVPGFGDEVIIPSGTVFIGPYNAKCDKIDILTGAVLEVQANGYLYLEANATTAIYNEGTLICDGSLSLTQLNGGPGYLYHGIHNWGEVYLNHRAAFYGSFFNGIQNENGGRVVNNGTLNCFDLLIRGINNSGDFKNRDLIFVTGSIMVLNDATGIFINSGHMENVDASTGSSSALGVKGVFINEPTGSIEISNQVATSSSITCFNAGQLNNFGDIRIDNVNSIAGISVNSDAVFINEINSSIEISNFHSAGISVRTDAIFRNKGQLTIDEGQGHGVEITNAFMVNHQRGTMTISNVNHGIDIFQGTGELRNFGTTNILNVSKSIVNDGQLVNRPKGKLICEDRLVIYSQGNFINQGHFKCSYNGASNHVNSGTITNHGAFGDQNNKFTGVNNQSVSIIPFTGTVQEGVPVPNALDVGGLGYVTIMDWYTTNSGSTIAGTYDQANNTFTPNANAVGLTTVYVRIRINTGGVTRRHPVHIPGGVQSFTGGGGSGWVIDDSNDKAQWSADLEVFPNPAAEQIFIKINNDGFGVNEEATIILTDGFGREVLSQKVDLEAEKVTLELPAALTNGTYWLKIRAGSFQPPAKAIQIFR